MSVPFGCHCPERAKPVNQRKWRVTQRLCNHSAFNGYRYTPSDYSTVMCMACNAVGRTKAKYVAYLADATNEELGIRGDQ
jgi:hypothetical protein